MFRRLPVRAPASLLGRLAFWLLLITVVLTAGRWLPGVAGKLFWFPSFVSVCGLLFVLFPLLWRYTIGRFLWKVRNRLIVTYLLMGLAPVVLFVSLAAIASYIFLGQFAIFAASAEMDRALQEMSAQNRDYARHLSHTLDSRALDSGLPGAPASLPEREAATAPTASQSASTLISTAHLAAFVDGKPLKLAIEEGSLAEHVDAVPRWVPGHFRGVVLADHHLFLRAIDSEQIGRHLVTVISSVPIEGDAVDIIAHGLGRITIVPDISLDRADDQNEAPITSEASQQRADAVRPNTVTGGVLPAAEHFYDLPVNFVAPLATTEWQSGSSHGSGLHVTSRPTLLYRRLFITSLQVATVVQDVLIGFAIFFGLLELGAFLMAVRLNQTITRSVSDLYTATLAIDNRDFTHRIEVTRKDQLAALSASFNTMTSSLERLLEEQREKERLLGELEIAQEVQANLYPSGNVSLPSLEVYGICQPARTVSGDYYDFLVSGSNELSLALGDISGKGISAALLMATLHSAVHAYRFAGDDMRSVSAAMAADDPGSRDAAPLLGASFTDPGQILGLLNRHLYRSTQPEKYATLFLAYYNGQTSELTYSTGGQPPPLLLRADDSVVRLDCGGTVIGLLDNMRYEQGTETLRAGDIVVAYSDGVTEPENEFGDFGEDRLLALVRLHRKLPLDQIASQVLQALRSWIGTAEQPDDITIVLARQR
ncbi:MAG TPA: SpoIIE family protein phosphatase [Acidobacteriaceae bacterium]